MQVLNYSDAFSDVYHKQVNLVKDGKLKAESYFSVLPSGDVVSDADLDMFLCDKMFEEEFEFTIADQSSVAPSLRFSIGKSESRAFSLKKGGMTNVNKTTNKLRKLASFNLEAKNLHHIDDFMAAESKENSSRCIDMSHISHNNSLLNQDSFLSSSPLDDEMNISPMMKFGKVDGLFTVPEQSIESSPEFKFKMKSPALMIKPLPTEIIAEEVKEHASSSQSSKGKQDPINTENNETHTSKKRGLPVLNSEKDDSDSSIFDNENIKPKEKGLTGPNIRESSPNNRNYFNQKSLDIQPNIYQFNTSGSDGIILNRDNNSKPSQIPGAFSSIVNKKLNETIMKENEYVPNIVNETSPVSFDGRGVIVEKISEQRDSNTCTKCSQNDSYVPFSSSKARNLIDTADQSRIKSEEIKLRIPPSLRPSNRSSQDTNMKTLEKASDSQRNEEDHKSRSYSGSKSNDLLSEQEYINRELRQVLLQQKGHKNLKIPSRVEREHNVNDLDNSQAVPRISNSGVSNGTTSPSLIGSPGISKSSKVEPATQLSQKVGNSNNFIHSKARVKQLLSSNVQQKQQAPSLRLTLSGQKNDSSPIERDIPVEKLLRDSDRFVSLYRTRKTLSKNQDELLNLHKHISGNTQTPTNIQKSGPYKMTQNHSEGVSNFDANKQKGYKTERGDKLLTISTDLIEKFTNNSKTDRKIEPLKLNKSDNETKITDIIHTNHTGLTQINKYKDLMKRLSVSQQPDSNAGIQNIKQIPKNQI